MITKEFVRQTLPGYEKEEVIIGEPGRYAKVVFSHCIVGMLKELIGKSGYKVYYVDSWDIQTWQFFKTLQEAIDFYFILNEDGTVKTGGYR